MKQLLSTVFSLLLISLLPAQASATDVYKWIDENGVPSFGERPPEGVSYIKLQLHGNSKSKTKSKAELSAWRGSSQKPKPANPPQKRSPATKPKQP